MAGVATIVVGVDGSEGSARALRWALNEARLRGAQLRVIHAWFVPLVLALPSEETFGIPEPPGSMEEIRAALAKEAANVLAAAMQDIEAGDVHVGGEVIEGKPARVLTEAAADGDLLVVGGRGLGGFTGLLLGSVSQQCAHHARCPLVIVPSYDPNEPSVRRGNRRHVL
jgi:nucleotide-binding universal stress UspA family protein